MSIVRYTNKKTGVVTLYESTSHYDPETKQSRPIRKYLGIEDPETGELIPSTKQRGRKKKGEESSSSTSQRLKKDYEKLYEDTLLACREKDRIIKAQEAEIKRLRSLISGAQLVLAKASAEQRDAK